MRIAVLLVWTIIPAAAQNPLVQLQNTSRPISGDFQIGDHFEVVIIAAPNQTISVRTTRQGYTDWSPTIGSTDATGRWSATGQFEKSDLGGWGEIWTVGGKLASPVIQFSVTAPCLPGSQSYLMSGSYGVLYCETTAGQQTFAPPSPSDPFRTADGRLVPGRPTEESPRQYHMQIIQDVITGAMRMSADGISLQSSRGGLGDETAELIDELVGVNALTGDETRNALALLRAAFAKPETIQPSAKEPSKTLQLLQHMADLTSDEALKQEIADTIAYVQAVH